jgi:hypothetical protein
MVVHSSSANRAKALTGPCKNQSIYNTVIRAIIESAFIAWVGLLIYVMTNLYNIKQGDAQANYIVSWLPDDGAIAWVADIRDRLRLPLQSHSPFSRSYL